MGFYDRAPRECPSHHVTGMGVAVVGRCDDFLMQWLCVSATIQIRDNPFSIKNKNLQAPNYANTKSSRDPGRESTLRINPCPSVSIRVPFKR